METSHRRLLVLSLLMLGGCGGGDQLILPGDGQPAAIDVVEGEGQSGVVGEPLADPVIVEVTDSRGRPVEGVSVAFEFGGAGAGADVIPETAETNSEGRADAQLVLGTAIGRQTGRARVVTEGSRQPIVVTFSATALSESANRMEAVAGQDQTGHVGQPLDDRLVVEVTDGFGNPVPDVPINWSAEGGGRVSEATVRTGDDGRARVERVLGPAVGPQTTIATSEGLAGSPLVFDHTAIAGNASRLVIESGNEQSAAAGSAVANDLVVRLVDADGNGVSRTGLSWVVATGGGSASPENTVTDGNGRASTRWTLGETLGNQRIDAVVSGVGFLSFKATATAGAPAALSISTQPSSSAGNGVPFDRQPVIQLRDSRGNAAGVAGVPVRASLASGGGELLGTLVRSTDGSGRAGFTDLAIAGDAGARTLFFSAEGYAGATSDPITVGAPANRSPSAGFTFSCQNLSCSFADGSSDPDGSVVSYSWNFGDGGGSGERNPGHTYAAEGTYQVALTVTDDDGATGAASRSVTVNRPPGPGNRAPNANFNWFCPSLTCDFTDASSDQDGQIVNRVWDWGDGTTTTNVLNPSHTYAAAGVYRVTLTVTDNGGLTAVSDDDVDPKAQSLRIRREPSGSAAQGVPFERQPEIELRAGDRGLNQAGVVITASIATGGGTLGGTVTATTDGQGRAAFTDLSIGGAAGPHTLRFTAPGYGEAISSTVDVGGASSTTTITSDDPDPSIAGSTVTVNVAVTSGTGTTPTGNVTVSVSAVPGSTAPPPCTVALSNGSATCQFELNVVGDRVFTATYSGDGLHNGSQDQEPHRVDPVPTPNQPPTAEFTPLSCTTNVSCQFSGAESEDLDGTITAYTWDFGDNSPTQSGVEVVHTYTAPSADNQYQVTLTVTDDEGATASVTHQVTVTTPPPPAVRMLNLRAQPGSSVTSGAALDPQPEVELRLSTGEEIQDEGVVISVSVGSGDGVLGGEGSRDTDDNGRARFEDLTISGAPGSSVTLHFTAPGYAAVDSQPILIN